MRRIGTLLAIVAVVAGLAAGGWWLAGGGLSSTSGGDGAAAASAPPAERATAEVTRQTLEVTETFDGTLGYSGEVEIPGGLNGTLTWMVPEGTVVARGERLYETDGRNRASLLYGVRPAWRTMADGVDDGSDIQQLEENLQALGYTRKGDTIDDHWDDDTTAAVERWQKAKRLVVDGEIQLGEVVFTTGPVLVSEQRASLGSNVGPGATILAGTSDQQVVSVDLAADDRELVSVGQPVEVELPDGSTTSGTIATIGRVATAGTDQQTGGSGTPTIAVTVTLDDPAAAGELDEAPVEVSVVTSSREDVLTVPVNALLALLEGGYAVELSDATGTHLVAVEPGLYQDGVVEVTSDVLSEGDLVVVPT